MYNEKNLMKMNIKWYKRFYWIILINWGDKMYLEVKDLVKCYGEGENKVQVLKKLIAQ